MGFQADAPAVSAALPAEDDLSVLPAQHDADLPKQETPREGEFKVNLSTLLAQSNKDPRMFYCGLYQAVLQSGPEYGTRLFKTLEDWHAFVDSEVDHYARRVLEKSKELQ